MTRKIDISSFPVFDIKEDMKTEEDMAQYLAIALEDGDPAFLELMMQEIATARARLQKNQGAAQTPPASDIGFGSVLRACQSLGLKLTAQPA